MKCTHKQKHQTVQTRETASPCFVEVLFKLGLVEKTIAIKDAYFLFLKIGGDPIVSSKEPKGFLKKKITAPYAVTALKLNALSADELKSLKLRVAEFR